MSDISITENEVNGKIGYQFHAIPMHLKSVFLTEKRKPSQIERLYWILANSRIRPPSIRSIATNCSCSRHQAKLDLIRLKLVNDTPVSFGHSSATFRPPFGHSSATKPPLETEQGSVQEAKNGHLSATKRPPFGHLSATLQPQRQPCEGALEFRSLDQLDKELETHICGFDDGKPKLDSHEKKRQHEAKIRAYLRKPLGKSVKPKDVTISAAEVWNHWSEFWPRTRIVTLANISAIKRALKTGYSISDLKLITRWAAQSNCSRAVHNRTKGFIQLTTIFGLKKLDGNFQDASNWDESNPQEPIKSADLEPLDETDDDSALYGPLGHRLPQFGGLRRKSGMY